MRSPERWKLLFTRVPFFAILAFFAVCELRFGVRLENHQPGEAAAFVELQHDVEILQQLSRQF